LQIIFLFIFILSDHAAGQSGSRAEKFAEAISQLRSQDVCSRPAAKTSGMKNIASAIFFTLFLSDACTHIRCRPAAFIGCDVFFPGKSERHEQGFGINR
jgi:hypothetical protein